MRNMWLLCKITCLSRLGRDFALYFVRRPLIVSRHIFSSLLYLNFFPQINFLLKENTLSHSLTCHYFITNQPFHLVKITYEFVKVK